MTTKVDVEALLRLAGEAREVYEAEAGMMTNGRPLALDAFIAAASPDVVRSLCEEVLRLRRIEEAADAYVYTLDVAPVLPLRDGASAVERAEMVGRNRVRAGAENALRAALKAGV